MWTLRSKNLLVSSKFCLLLLGSFCIHVCLGGGDQGDDGDGEMYERAKWHDPNIVHDGKHWVKVPEDTWGNPHAMYDERWKKNSSTIIVLIAALRESRLTATLKSAFDQAAVPGRIRVGVVQQNAPGDPDCLEELCQDRGKPLTVISGGGTKQVIYENPNGCEEFDKVRVLRMDASEAAGPVYARGKQPEVLQDEDFCMQIDAHTVFKRNWDMMLLREWALTNNEFAVLSTYPTNYKDLDKNSNHHWEMPHICGATLSSSGHISNHQAGAAANLEKPLLAPLWAAGLSFSRCHAERDVPNDVNLKQIFSGEEFSRGARLWTHGYDFYSISRPTIGVYYGSDKGGKGHWRHDRDESAKSSARLKTLLKFPDSDQSPEALAALGKFGLGTRRTLQQYADFTGINTMTMKSVGKKCIVKYVDWDDSGLFEKIKRDEMELALRYAPRANSNDNTDSNNNNNNENNHIRGNHHVVEGIGEDVMVAPQDLETPSFSATMFALVIFAFIVWVFVKLFRSKFRKKRTL